MATTCAVAGCDLTPDAAWRVVDDPESGDLVEIPVCGLHYPDLASGATWSYDENHRIITLG